MRKYFSILFLTVVFYLIEFILFNVLGKWFTPNLLLLLVIFVTFYLGIRFGLLTALLAGGLRDSFAVGIFGANIFSFIVCAYVVVLLRRYIFHNMTDWTRVIFFLCIISIHFSVCATLYFCLEKTSYLEAFRFIYIPSAVTTVIAGNFVFRELKKCAPKLFV